MRKKILSLVVVFLSFFVGIHSFAEKIGGDDVLNFDLFLNLYIQSTTKNLNPEYKEVKVLYTNIEEDTLLYDTMQRLIFLHALPNIKTSLDLDHPISKKSVANFLDPKHIIDISREDEYIDLDWALLFIKKTITYYKDPQTILARISMVLKENYLHIDNIPDYRNYSSVDSFLKDLGDPYAKYYPYKEAKIFRERLQAEKVGIGVFLQQAKDGSLVVMGLVAGGSAEAAGIHTGDVIIGVNDISFTSDMLMGDMIKHISGDVGTSLNIVVNRNFKRYTIPLTRKKIHIDTMRSSVLDTGLCMIHIRFFAIGGIQDFAATLEDLEDKNCSQFVFDLRGNPGGSLTDTYEMLWYFVKKGEPVLALQNNKDKVFYYSKKNLSHYFAGKKMYFLINKNSASASELFVGVIKYYHPDSVILGTRSFGKGTAQSVKEFLYGDTLKYTISQWLIGKNPQSIDKIGITPDVFLEDDIKTPKDELLERVKNDAKKHHK